jgi:hypothetical protein
MGQILEARICLCHKLPFLFCASDRNFLQFTSLSCTVLLIFKILVCFGCFFSFPFLFSGNSCRLFSCFAPSTYQNSVAGFVTFVDGRSLSFEGFPEVFYSLSFTAAYGDGADCRFGVSETEESE